jgi:hypothetical protein
MASTPYWMNHCAHCGAKVGDYEAIDCTAAPFNVQSVDVRRLQMTVVSSAFEATGLINLLGVSNSDAARSKL